jgi:hypothetical protein
MGSSGKGAGASGGGGGVQGDKKGRGGEAAGEGDEFWNDGSTTDLIAEQAADSYLASSLVRKVTETFTRRYALLSLT